MSLRRAGPVSRGSRATKGTLKVRFARGDGVKGLCWCHHVSHHHRWWAPSNSIFWECLSGKPVSAGRGADATGAGRCNSEQWDEHSPLPHEKPPPPLPPIPPARVPLAPRPHPNTSRGQQRHIADTTRYPTRVLGTPSQSPRHPLGSPLCLVPFASAQYTPTTRSSGSTRLVSMHTACACSRALCQYLCLCPCPCLCLCLCPCPCPCPCPCLRPCVCLCPGKPFGANAEDDGGTGAGLLVGLGLCRCICSPCPSLPRRCTNICKEPSSARFTSA